MGEANENKISAPSKPALPHESEIYAPKAQREL